MTNERLNQLQMRAAKASALAEELAALEAHKNEGDRHGLDYILRCEIHRLGHGALMKQKQDELEKLLGDSRPSGNQTADNIATAELEYKEWQSKQMQTAIN